MSQGKSINVIQFLSFEDLGNLKQWFHRQNYAVNILQAGVDDLSQILVDKTPLIILGGPIGVYETSTYPFLTAILEGLSLRLKVNLPTLGVCLGAQLIASALGAKVYSGHVKEIGWSQLKLTEAGQASLLHVLEQVEVLHWHGDTFDLPDHAILLASSEHYPYQAFMIGKHILGLQFHVEVNPAEFERWLIGHACELSKANIDIKQLREHNKIYGAKLVPQSHAIIKAWLDA